MRVVAIAVALCACSKDSTAPTAAAPPAAVVADHQLHRTWTADGIVIAGKAVPLATQPMVDWIGLPMSGDIDVAIDIKTSGDLRKANGTIAITCPANCRLGDDKTTLKPKSARASAFAGELYFGHIDFDRIDVGITVTDGKATITKWNVVSKDIELELKGGMELGRTLAESRVDACVRFKGTPALAARDPKTNALILVTGAVPGADGMFNIKLVDRFGDLKVLARICDGSQPSSDARPVLEPAGADASTPPASDTTIDPKLAAAIAAAITKQSDTTFEINAAKWRELLADATTLGKGVRVVPAIKDGKPHGMKLYAIRPESLAARLGFSNGDTMLTVAGLPLAPADQMLEAYQKVRGVKAGEVVTVTLQRKGQPLTLTYRLR